MNWYLTTLPSLCAGTALLELEGVHIGQWMLSRPFLVGPILGACVGNLLAGATFGILVELLTVGELPVGNVVPSNGAVAAATAVLMGAGPHAVNGAVALPAGLVTGAMFSWLEKVLRSRRGILTQMAEAALDRGEPVPFGRLLVFSACMHLLTSAAFLYIIVAAGGPALAVLWKALPQAAVNAFSFAFSNAAVLGAASILYALRLR